MLASSVISSRYYFLCNMVIYYCSNYYDVNVYQKYYYSNYYDVNVNKYKVKCEISLRFWENEGWINSIDPYLCFQWYFRYCLGRRRLDDKRQIAGWKIIVKRFKGKLVKIIKEVDGRFDDYSISPVIKQFLLP